MTRALARPLMVSGLYLLATLVMTWPIAGRLTRDLPGDLGDPAFVTGIIAWGSEHWLSLFTGDLAAASRFWDGPIFYPEPLTIAYSEHFALHSLVTLPAYAVTKNPILSYNLWFLSTFVLSGLGMYLLVRELTGREVAGFVAGLAFAFAPYRVATMPHLQVLSSQWMPFVLFGLRRYFSSGNTDGLLWAGAALWAQNLSSGYYMVFFGPFAALYALVEIGTRGWWRRLTVWRDLIVSAGVALAATLPFVMPYLIRQRGARRPMFEVVWYSADLMGWLTASPLLHVWGRLQTFVKAEGFLFPGVTVMVLVGVGIWQSTRIREQGTRVIAIFGVAALVLSFWLALGPQIQIETQPVNFPALYRLAWEYLPGFNVARVPARFATITVLSLAILAGAGLTRLDRDGHPRGRWLALTCGLLLLAEGAAFPLPVNGTWTSAPNELLAPEPRLYRLADAPPVYRFLHDFGGPMVVAHFPFGPPEREIQYGYYATLHRRRIVNGYSGAFPPSYNIRLGALRDPIADPSTAMAILEGDRVTHAVVHTAAWINDRGQAIANMFERAGWLRAAEFDRDLVYEAPWAREIRQSMASETQRLRGNEKIAPRH
jgi:hypothetical protein